MSTISYDPASDDPAAQRDAGTSARQPARTGAALARPLGSLRDTAANRLRDVADDGKSHVVSTIAGLVQAAREFAERLDGGAGGPVASYAHQAADALGDWQQTIETKSVEDLMAEGRELVRRSPGVALGVAVATGFVLARLVKATGDGQ